MPAEPGGGNRQAANIATTQQLALPTPSGYNRIMKSIESLPSSIDTSAPGAAFPPRQSTSYAADKDKILARLRRMEGQVRGVQKMVEQDQYCLDVLTQLSAIMAAARGVGLLVLEDHLRGCVLGTCEHGHADREDILEELTGAIERFTRTAS